MEDAFFVDILWELKKANLVVHFTVPDTFTARSSPPYRFQVLQFVAKEISY